VSKAGSQICSCVPPEIGQAIRRPIDDTPRRKKHSRGNRTNWQFRREGPASVSPRGDAAGEGDVQDHSKVKRVAAGEVVLVPGNPPHYEGSEGEIIIVGITTSPFNTRFLEKH
jgi:hypothetical protein